MGQYLETNGCEDEAILENFQQQDPSLMERQWVSYLKSPCFKIWGVEFDASEWFNNAVLTGLSYPWMKAHPDYPSIRVAHLSANPNGPTTSFISFPLLHAHDPVSTSAGVSKRQLKRKKNMRNLTKRSAEVVDRKVSNGSIHKPYLQENGDTTGQLRWIMPLYELSSSKGLLIKWTSRVTPLGWSCKTEL